MGWSIIYQSPHMRVHLKAIRTCLVLRQTRAKKMPSFQHPTPRKAAFFYQWVNTEKIRTLSRRQQTTSGRPPMNWKRPKSHPRATWTQVSLYLQPQVSPQRPLQSAPLCLHLHMQGVQHQQECPPFQTTSHQNPSLRVRVLQRRPLTSGNQNEGIRLLDTRLCPTLLTGRMGRSGTTVTSVGRCLGNFPTSRSVSHPHLFHQKSWTSAIRCWSLCWYWLSDKIHSVVLLWMFIFNTTRWRHINYLSYDKNTTVIQLPVVKYSYVVPWVQIPKRTSWCEAIHSVYQSPECSSMFYYKYDQRLVFGK